MSRDRFAMISSIFTICPPDGNPGADARPYWKVQHLMEEFNTRCKQNYNCSRFLSRDEQCIKMNHRTSLRHYHMPKRMIQEGIRVECITSKLGVMQHSMLDLPNVTHFDQTMNLLGTLSKTGHVVFMVRLYTSAKLVN